MSDREPAPTVRRFHLSDFLVLVASSALMLSSERAVYGMWATFSQWFMDVPSWNSRELTLMARSLALASLSLVLLCSLLIRPRDRARLRAGAPGLLVHLAVATVIVVRLVGWVAVALIFFVFQGKPDFYPTRWTVEIMDYLRDDLRREAVIAVAATWLTLKLSGRWKPERAWDDRLGRFVGVLWMIFYLGAPLLVLLP